MKLFSKAIFSLLFIVLFNACTIEKAHPSKKQHLRIASDCLTRKDEKLLRNFEKKYKIDIHIVPISVDSIQQLLKKEGLATNIDCILVGSVYDMASISEAKMLHQNSMKDVTKQLSPKYISDKKDFIGIGFDPYVFLTKNDTLVKWKNYADLVANYQFTSDLITKTDLYPYYSTVYAKIQKSGQKQVKKWMSQFLKNKQTSLNDSLQMNGTSAFFTLYSHYEKNKSTFKHLKKFNLIFPNQRKAGVYYNMVCFGVVKQARNYTNAQLFLNYLLIDNVNKRIAHRLSFYPIITGRQSAFSYQNKRFKKSSVSPIHQSTFYGKIKLIINNI
jgi:ABC-type Fe3+ transport system substrate-binding protein